MSGAYGQTLDICCNLSIFLSSIFNIAQRGISGRHAFLKPEPNKSGHWDLRMVRLSGARSKSAAWEGREQSGVGVDRAKRLSGLRLDAKLSGRQRVKKWSMLILEWEWLMQKMRCFPTATLNNTPWLETETQRLLLLITVERWYVVCHTERVVEDWTPFLALPLVLGDRGQAV